AGRAPGRGAGWRLSPMVPVAAAAWWLQNVTSVGRLGDFTLLALGGALALGVYVLVLRVAVPRQIGGGS
ncbi:MAG TPA: hypothetical protein VJT72_09690, partial [Pseudonocardiaceae bacterium]|nr:hypothetical protein [Pseudonocardiaceae bacterium]